MAMLICTFHTSYAVSAFRKWHTSDHMNDSTLCSHLEVWGDGGGSEMKWLPSSRPAARFQSTAGYFQWASGTFTATSMATDPGFICCFFGGAFHGFIQQDILETDDRKWDKRLDDMQPGCSTNWGTNEPQTQVFLGKVFVPNQIWTTCVCGS